MSATVSNPTLSRGLALHQAGRLREAEQAYRQVLAAEPRHPEALHLLGLLAHHTGHLAAAVELIREAIGAQPSASHFHSNLGNALREQGHLEEAEAAYRQALVLDAKSLEAQSNLAVIVGELGRREEALALLRAVIRVAPDDPDLQSNFASMLIAQGQFAEALEAAEAAVRLCGTHADGHFNLGQCRTALGLLEEAISALQRAHELRPDHVPTLVALANVMSLSSRHGEAIHLYGEALDRNPRTATALLGLSHSLCEEGRFDEAVTSARAALDLDPSLADAHLNLSVALGEQGAYDEAFAEVQRGCALAPGSNRLRLADAYLRLLRGDYLEGFRRYEARWEAPGFSAMPRFTQPRWQGEPLAGRTLLIHAEQGFGDAIQFIRFASAVADRGARVLVACDPALVSIFQTAPGVTSAVAAREPWPEFDYHIAMLSLPALLGTTINSIPQKIPYLATDRHRVEGWKTLLSPDRRRLRVGLAWKGSAANLGDPHRSISLEELAPLFAISGIDFYSLQKDASPQELAMQDSTFIDHTAHLENFAETAALMSQLDLVVSVDTAALHLAGALGRPVWALLRFCADWRYSLHASSTPWYLGMRLFRQRKSREWPPVIKAICEELSRAAAQHWSSLL